LKNALDWVSRTKGGPWTDKPVAILSAAAGMGGGDRAQFALRLALAPFGARVLNGREVMVGGAADAFDDAGKLKNPKSVEFLGVQMKALRALMG
jgi:chromate reductase